MSIAVKSILGLGLTLGVVAIGVSAAVTQGFKFDSEEINEQEEASPESPKTETLRIQRSWISSSNETPSMFGKIYRHYLANTENDANTQWWTNQYEKIKNDLGEGAFKDVSDADALKNKCKEAYDIPYNSGNPEGFLKSKNTNNFTINDLFKYCSGLGGIPKKLTDNLSNYPANSIAKQTGHNGSWVSADDNEEFWSIRDDEFHEKNNWNIEAKNDYDNSSDQTTQITNLFAEGKKNNKHIKELCKEAYSDTSFDSIVVVAGYCSFKYPGI